MSPKATAPLTVSCLAALAALQHVAESASASDLRGSRDLLADTAKRVVTGADERVWPAAAPAACALMTAAEGVSAAPVPSSCLSSGH